MGGRGWVGKYSWLLELQAVAQASVSKTNLYLAKETANKLGDTKIIPGDVTGRPGQSCICFCVQSCMVELACSTTNGSELVMHTSSASTFHGLGLVGSTSIATSTPTPEALMTFHVFAGHSQTIFDASYRTG